MAACKLVFLFLDGLEISDLRKNAFLGGVVCYLGTPKFLRGTYLQGYSENH